MNTEISDESDISCLPPTPVLMADFDVLRRKTSQNVLYFMYSFGSSTFFLYFCRRFCDVVHCIMSHNGQELCE